MRGIHVRTGDGLSLSFSVFFRRLVFSLFFPREEEEEEVGRDFFKAVLLEIASGGASN